MLTAQRTVVIDRPPDEVFAFFTDPTNDQKWRTHVREMAPEGPVGVGTRIHQVIEGPGGRDIPADLEVTTYDPPRRYAFQVVAGPVRPRGALRFTADGEATAVTFSINATLSGVKRLLLSRPVKASIKGEMAALDRAKAIIENA